MAPGRGIAPAQLVTAAGGNNVARSESAKIIFNLAHECHNKKPAPTDAGFYRLD